MSAGQAVLSGVLDVGALDAVESRLEAREAARHSAYAEQLRDALELDRLHHAAGLELATTAQLALVLRCSEARATRLLQSARVLADLPGALELLDAAVLTVEQSRVVVELLDALAEPARLALWERASSRLARDAEQGVLRPPARLAELLRRWALEADPAPAQERRRRAEADGDVQLRRRDDGLVDVFATGLTAPNAAACLSRISERSAPFGVDDERSAGKRRLDALVDLLTGRDALPFEHRDPCGCPLGAGVPCGAQVTVLVPLSTAMGGSAPAEQVGHGPVEADLAHELLRASPALRVAWVDDDGVPVGVCDRVERPPRRDDAGLRAALDRLMARPAAPLARHPDDHPPGRPDEPPPRRVRARPHPPDDDPGPYRVPTPLRRLLEVRAPRCEWPGCGARASRCDLDHDVAWPCGPTCACNLGPLCRRHHRVKQLGWSKQRARDGVRWTSPTGRVTLSPGQHQPPVTDVAPAAPSADPLEHLGPVAREHELHRHEAWLEGDSGLGRSTRAEEQHWAAELALLRRWAAEDDSSA